MGITRYLLIIIWGLSAENIFLFDMDGTLTPSRQRVEPKILIKLNEFKKTGFHTALVGGSDFNKIREQM